ncbi:serine/threonine kinase 4 [Homo sapiens]|uniref:Serine/threonine kinase 4 n=2 Tax=Hominidae TaxID=9604 RepID=A0A087WYT4_HUMAN|nr:serine/threonine kinase 4 [Homo sapiens]KAI4005681.1 serine/threonine kinase 4 [Homo sapiens]PNJ86147.1 STK4 isoform 5 [Pongo abelii]
METVQLRNPPRRQLKKLDEDSLTKQPEEVFDVLEKLGEGWKNTLWNPARNQAEKGSKNDTPAVL